ncbi:MAG TPA: glycerol-3-phosphate dehydrogenase/oxidase [Spirochaetia bacterium]|nr:glycerol-3-phosphate dehydrogenase/oxidase [Spirochaetia bacterium]
MTGLMWRDLKQLTGPWDVLIVGGGITGAGILGLATRLGWRALLLEQRDFAWGASSRSGKLVHGGLRYLAQGRVRLTRESVRERERLLAEAPGLVEPQPFLLPVYRGQTGRKIRYRAGLWLYDRLAGQRTRRSFDAADLGHREPCLDHPDLVGGFSYRDARTDDARLVLRLILDAVREGGFALNYAPVTGLLTSGAGQVSGVTGTDEVSNRCFAVKAGMVINAAGAWSDRLREHIGGAPVLRPLRGSHLVFPATRLPLGQGVNLVHPEDGRPLYAFPWEGVTLVGTTDLDHRGDLQGEPAVTPAEKTYLLEAVQAFFPSLGLREEDIQAAFAGIRPVVGTGHRDPSRESRDMFLREEKNLITVTGGKLTTFRLLAQRALELAGKKLSLDTCALAGCRVFSEDLAQSADPLARRLLARYGPAGACLPPGDQIPGTLYHWGEVGLAATEMVVHLDDLLLRRLRLGLVAPRAPWLERIGAIVRPALGWDDARWRWEQDRYRGILARAYRPG